MFSNRDGWIMGAVQEGIDSGKYQRSGVDKYYVELS